MLSHVEITQSAPYSKELAINPVCANANLDNAAALGAIRFLDEFTSDFKKD
jgi:hypothetical protein